MKLKIVAAIMFILLAVTAFAWPPIPKAIASGSGWRTSTSGHKETFLWYIGISLSESRNIYVLLPIHNKDADRQKLESDKIKVFLHDNESVILKVRLNTDDKNSRQIAQTVTEEISSLDHSILFDLNSAKYNPRP